MKTARPNLTIRELLLRQMFFRIFLPLLIMVLAVNTVIGFFMMENAGKQQHVVTGAVVEMINYHIEHGDRILEAVKYATENADDDSIAVFLNSSWKAYGYFETIYYLDDSKKVKFVEPYNQQYENLDMSNLPIFTMQSKDKKTYISKPFISLTTGEPILYIVKLLKNGRYLIGELNLGILQNEVENILKKNNGDLVYILDQSGNLLAHPDIKLVKEQMNMSNLKIFTSNNKSGFEIYDYDGELVFGAVETAPVMGWKVVDQIKIVDYWKYYIQAALLVMLIAMILWQLSRIFIRRRFEKDLVAPVEQMLLQANAIYRGDYNQIDVLRKNLPQLVELNRLSLSFIAMAENLQLREKALKESYDELEAKVVERTAEITGVNRKLQEMYDNLRETQQQLIQTEKMAGLGTVVAGVAHELNNPVNYISLSAHVLEKKISKFEEKLLVLIDENDKEIKDFFKTEFSVFFESIKNIIEGSGRVKTIVQDLRTFSRLDESDKKEISIKEIIKSTVRIAKSQFSKYADFEINVMDIMVVCYPSQLGQVFLNIILNACQAIIKKQAVTENNAKPGKLEITAKIYNNELQISFKDNGCGMNDEVKHRIFEPFFTTKPVGQGTGLGLSVSYGIIEKHNGRITVESKEGIGTTVMVILPLDKNIKS